MAVIALDTFEVVQELRAAGFTEEQAAAVTRVVRKAQDVDLSALAAKSDLQLALAETRAELQRDLAETSLTLHRALGETKADLQRALGENKTDILKWVLGSMGLQTVAIIGAVLAMTRFVGHG